MMSRIKKLANSGDLQELMNSFGVKEMQEIVTQNQGSPRYQQFQQYFQGSQPQIQQQLGDQLQNRQQRFQIQTFQQGPQQNPLQQNSSIQSSPQNIPSQNIQWQKTQQAQLDLLKNIKEVLEKIAGNDKNKPGCCPSNSFQPCPPLPAVSTKRYNDYYDVFHRIAVAGPIDPNDPDSPVYNREMVHAMLGRNSEVINVANHGSFLLFIRESHIGTADFELETPIFPGTVRTFYNIFEIRLRSPRQGLPYSVSEYGLASAFEATPQPIEKANLQDVSLPDPNTNWLSSDIVPTFSPTNFILQVAVSIPGIFYATITNNGDTQTVILNPTSPQLIAMGLYRFDIMVHPGDSVNFRYSTSGGVIQVLRAHEIS